MYLVGEWGKRGSRAVLGVRAVAARERQRLLLEIAKVRGLLPLLMKPRNDQKWTRKERALIVAQLRRLSQLSPYLMLLVLPGGFLALPALAWWLDRRRTARRGARRAAAPGCRRKTLR
jgi:hypothetical protein